jgi:hypothetical protein
MGLNNIELPASLVADLYRNDLLEEELTASPVHSEKKAPAIDKTLQYLGKNLKNVVLLVNYENDVYLPENQLTFLTNILLACKLNLADVAIVNYNKQQPSLESLVHTLKPNCLLVFGIPGFDSSLAGINEFTVRTTEAGTFILSPTLESLNNTSQEGKLLKSKLWLCLKQFFNV